MDKYEKLAELITEIAIDDTSGDSANERAEKVKAAMSTGGSDLSDLAEFISWFDDLE